MKTFFHHNIHNLITKVTNCVLNDEQVLRAVYRRLSLFDLINHFTSIPNNVLAIGSKHMWIVNCASAHPEQFIGTCRAISFPRLCTDQTKWTRIQNFILRY